MIQFDEQMLRRGGNQLGVVAISAGLIAYFVEPVPGAGEWYLVLVGTAAYLISALYMRPIQTTSDDDRGDDDAD